MCNQFRSFLNSEEVINEIKIINSGFIISEEGNKKLFEKYEEWVNKQDVFDDDYYDFGNYYDDYDYSSEGCGVGISCSKYINYGCNAHPCN